MRTHLFRKPPETGTYYVSYFADGQRTRKSLKTKNFAAARAMQKKIEQDLLLDKLPAQQRKVSLREFESRYFPFAEARKRPKTLGTERYVWNRFVKGIGVRHLGEINRSVVEGFLNGLLAEGKKKSTANIFLRHLSSMLSQSVQWNLLAGNPCRGISKFRIQEKKVVYLQSEEISKILDAAERHGYNIHLVFALGIYAGLRRNEIANTRWEWFDFENNVIQVTNEDGFETKSGRNRSIPLNEHLKRILLRYYEGKGGYIFYPERTTWKGLIRYDFKKAFDNVCQEVGLEWVTPHVLRHTFASRLAIAGVSLYKISQWLGHADMKTTQIYAHLQASDSDINNI
jgi:integrase